MITELDPQSSSSDTLGSLALVGAGALAVAGLSGCGLNPLAKSDDGSAPPALTNTITKLTVRDAAGAAVTVNGIAGGAAGVTFALDGGSAPTSKQVDPGIAGAAQAYSFATTGTGGSASVGITINPQPTDVAAAFHGSLVATRASVAGMAFPPSWDELMSYAGLTHAQIVERMVNRISGQPAEPYPAWIDEPILSAAEYNALSVDQRTAYNNTKYPRRQEFKAWFFRQMVTSPDPLSERLLLFWHNLYTSSASSLSDPQLIARQHRLYRQNLGGNLRTFLKAMAKDAGMCEYLDSVLNKKGKPNENFARELMELFTLGERTSFGGYAEADIPLVAICFTGYGVDAHENFQFNPSTHDFTTPVTLWGNARPATEGDGDWVLDQILAKVDGSGHSYAAIYLVTRLWREFIGDPAVSQAAILALADQLSGPFAWDLPSLYRALFTRPEFTDATLVGTRLRAPVELWVGYYRALQVQPKAWDENLWQTADLDQDLLDPENVFGWPGGTNWITVKSLVNRREYMSWLGGGYSKMVADRLANVLDILLLATDPIGAPGSGVTAGDKASDLITDSAYNLR
jgi:uncharacterized protein (DUF1800 family)